MKAYNVFPLKQMRIEKIEQLGAIMTNNVNIVKDSIFRKKAVLLLKKKPSKSGLQFSGDNTLKLIHELELHQVELEMQNEVLALARSAALDSAERYNKLYVAARNTAEKYTILYDFAPSGYFTLSKEGKIIELNICGSKMLGKERSHLRDRRLGLFITDDTKPVFNIFLEKVFNSMVKESCKITLSTNDKSLVYVYLTGIASENEEQCLVTMVDITEIRQAELALIKAKEKSEESDRFKSAFLANMSHEIRTPMNGILGFTELLKKPELSCEKQQKYISMIEKGGVRMLNIINDLIDISKIESGRTEVQISSCNVNDKLEYIYTFFKPEVEGKGMQIFFHNSLPTNEVVIQTDREKLIAILTNLVKNAIKYSEKGTIELGYTIKPATQLFSKTFSEPFELEFYVKDTGLGIPKDKMEVIFDRFVQANHVDKRVFQGAGLGLSIAKAYVEMLGGKIWVESEAGKGSTFFFTIPYNQDLYKVN